MSFEPTTRTTRTTTTKMTKEKEKEKEEEKANEILKNHEFIHTSWNVIASSFQDSLYGKLVEHQIESFNYFVEVQIPKTIEMFSDIRIVSDLDFDSESKKYGLEIYMSFSNFQLHQPQIHENNGVRKIMFPNEARTRNFFYAAAMFIDVNFKFVVHKGEHLQFSEMFHKTFANIEIGKLPIMLRSNICVLTQHRHMLPKETKECEFDLGGYFIINGSEKTVIAQERGAENRVMCYPAPKNKKSKYSFSAEIKSIPDHKTISPKQFVMTISSKNNGFGFPLLLQLPRVKSLIPLFILFRALGVTSDLDICNHILLNATHSDMKRMCQFLQASIVQANICLRQEDAIQYIMGHVSFSPSVYQDREQSTATKQREFTTREILHNDLFPHCRTAAEKKYFLGYMAFKLINVYFFPWKIDDRDSYLNKRVDLTGSLLNSQFRNHFHRLVKEAEKQILKEVNNGSWRNREAPQNIITESNIYKIIKSNAMEKLRNSLATGDFTLKQQPNANNKVGIAQVLSRLNYISSVSHLRRVSTPQEKSGKLIEPRKLHTTSYGFMCPAETPESHSVGVVKNLSVMTHITIPSFVQPLYEHVLPWILPLDDPQCLHSPHLLFRQVKVFINGNWVGIVPMDKHHPFHVFHHLKAKKLSGEMNMYTSIVFDTCLREIRLCNDAGRVTRPLWRVHEKFNHSLYLNKDYARQIENRTLHWDDLLSNIKTPETLIEFIDAEEQAYSMIAMKYTDLSHTFSFLQKREKEMLKKFQMQFENDVEQNDQHENENHEMLQSSSSSSSSSFHTFSSSSSSLITLPLHYTHCEIHPSTIFGVLGSCIPFPEHNQSPRNTYQSAQGKQATGIFVSNPEDRFDKTAHLLEQPSKPLVDTRFMNLMHMDRIPSGRMVIVAIMSWTGYNQEDSLIFNKGSIDRGLFSTTVFHTEKDEDKPRMNGEEEIRMKPDISKTVNIKMGANYNKLTSKGLLPVNTKVENRDVLIGKVKPIKESKNDPSKPKYTDQSKVHRTFEDSFVDKLYQGRNGEGYEFVKIRLRTYRKPIIGDKFSSRHGQKGTIGNIVPEENMPFATDGVKPDIIINPHAIPSRMTIGQLKETLLGKALCFLGLFGDGTAFTEINMFNVRKELQKRGYESRGNQILIDGLTGNQLPCDIFIGPVFYQRLKHMVNDKIHSREIGPPLKMTRQPTEGRSRDGGFRVGEMERDCMIAHGASRLLQDRMYDASDKYQIYVCDKCGMIASVNHREQIHICHMCRNKTDFSFVKIPYAAKLLFQQLMSMNIVPRIITRYSNFSKQQQLVSSSLYKSFLTSSSSSSSSSSSFSSSSPSTSTSFSSLQKREEKNGNKHKKRKVLISSSKK